MKYTALKQQNAEISILIITLSQCHTVILIPIKAHDFKKVVMFSTEWDLLWCPVDSLVSLHEIPDRLAVRSRGTVTAWCTQIEILTGTQNTHSVYSHKCEHSHNGCGDKQLRRQNQIHLKNTCRQEVQGDSDVMISYNAHKLGLIHYGVCDKCVSPFWWRHAECSDCPNCCRSPQSHHLCFRRTEIWPQRADEEIWWVDILENTFSNFLAKRS